MSRLNLTLDTDTLVWLERHAAQEKVAVASLARRLLQAAVNGRAALDRRRKLAQDYAAGRDDAAELLSDLEQPQLEGLLDEG
jgi:hypothetical protein